MRLVVVQPYVPKYRQPLFEGLHSRLLQSGIQLELATSSLDNGRHDGVVLRNQTKWGGWRFPPPDGPLRYYGTARGLRGADAVICELASGSLDTYFALLTRRWSNRRVGLWGHVEQLGTRSSRMDSVIEAAQIRAADHIFAYTEAGRQAVVAKGKSPERVTSLGNTVENRPYTKAESETIRARSASLARELQVEPGRAVLVLGSVVPEKAPDQIAQVINMVGEVDGSLRFLVAGDGQSLSGLQTACVHDNVRFLGRVDEYEKRALASLCFSILNPGRVGLIAVDSIFLKLPILTTTRASHAPEYSYLVPGHTCVAVQNVDELTREVVAMSRGEARYTSMRANLADLEEHYSMDAMVERFYLGAITLMSASTQAQADA